MPVERKAQRNGPCSKVNVEQSHEEGRWKSLIDKQTEADEKCIVVPYIVLKLENFKYCTLNALQKIKS